MSATKIEGHYMAVRDHFQNLCGTNISSKTTLKDFIRNFKSRILGRPYLEALFADRVSDLKNEIFQYYRDDESLRRIRGTLGTYTAYYMNQSRWIEKHGNLDGWNEYMESIDVFPGEELEQMEKRLWRCAVSNIVQLEKLWNDVRDEDARTRPL